MEQSGDNVIYGIHAVEELIEARRNEIERIYVVQDKSGGKPFEILKYARKLKIPCQVLPEERLDNLTRSRKHQGVAALCSQKPYEEIADLRKRLSQKESAPLILLPASVEDPGNMGAIIRSAVALGVDAILLERKRSVPINATVSKTSAGMVEHMALVKPRNLEGEIEQFIEEGYEVIGSMGGDFESPDKIDFTKPTIIVTGGEHKGIPPYLQKRCTNFTAIPMSEKAESFNVSNAAAIVLYEAARQRGFSI